MPSKLGDFLPEDPALRDQLLKPEQFPKPGHIIRLWFGNISKPHYKWLVVINNDPESGKTGGVFINSTINEKIFPNNKLHRFHFQLTQDNYTVLDHDSYIDCTEIIQKYTDKIRDQYRSNPSEVYRGRLSNEDFKTVVKLVTSSGTVPKKWLRRYHLKGKGKDRVEIKNEPGRIR